ncbi:MAG: HAD-IC family P-type ATPase, partial [Caldilineaceae bacterium]|nr:HAD-IC family P-type ATPase [Caldilineaceae bacterium]
DAGHSVVAIGTDDHVCGLISVGDAVREDSAAAVSAMKAAGIEHVAMLTGDNQGTAKAIAELSGVDSYHAELLPEDKAEAVRKLVEEYGHVAMVGDGVNDAPAMAQASLGIAMGAMGTDVAIETADIALMSDDLGKIAWLVRHSRRTLTIIKQNIAFALGLKLLFIVLAMGGLATLWMAIAADMGASLLVIFNGLRLLRDS